MDRTASSLHKVAETLNKRAAEGRAKQQMLDDRFKKREEERLDSLMDSSAAFSAKVQRYGEAKKRRVLRFQKLSDFDLTRKDLQVKQKQALDAVTQVQKAR